MSDVNYADITKNGLWKNNPALVQLLGLCPLLAVSGSVVNALGLGLATILVLVGSNIAVSMIRNAVTDAIRLPAFVMIIASFTTCTELLMKAFTYELYQILGIFIALIVTNCAILGRADAFASKNKILPSAIDGLMMGVGFALVLLAVGAVREALGSGTLFANMHLLLGEMGKGMTITLIDDYSGFLVAILPPGAFLVTGFLIALKNVIDQYREEKAKANAQPVEKVSRRVRTTGTIQ
ncbi:electron transport complex subunit E [Marinibactrum halimedae]|uniref:Ion-translocating oxidoreductase complex subunit E n=1 Tax=Marinibactrum halimedae TaxID=1444977 RepID=A0AA37WP30_9GAMM|nr:electron transport complex subunit E [Marinibactrum halimedae]MCD9460359.1 electron transport complex subunit E [Marinibactrum halimedae]GLS26796.1 electron transport complex subunit E [Marinibactrum halimedae]